MTPIRPLSGTILALSLAACQATTGSDFPRVSGALAPPGAPPGTCWGNIATPATVQTVTEQVLVAPASYNSDGTLYRAAQYRSDIRQEIVQERRERWFETPCPAAMTPEFIASLQRALRARDLYRGEATGQLDSATRRAIRRFQADRGLDTDALTLETAQALGLVAVSRG